LTPATRLKARVGREVYRVAIDPWPAGSSFARPVADSQAPLSFAKPCRIFGQPELKDANMEKIEIDFRRKVVKAEGFRVIVLVVFVFLFVLWAGWAAWS
jgi:hypothetical protein